MQAMRRTKIVATVGPATAAPGPMRQLLEAGVDVVRLNAAHADMDTHSNNARQARELAQVLGRSVGVLVDLPGPKIRSGSWWATRSNSRSGQEFVLSGIDDGHGDALHVATTLPDLAQWARPNDDVYLADGAIVLRVLEAVGNDVRTEVDSRRYAALAQGNAPAACRSACRSVHRARRPWRSRWRLPRRWTSSDFLSSAAPKMSSSVRAMLPKRGMRPALVAKIETAARSTTLRASSTPPTESWSHAAISASRCRRARAAPPEGDHPLLQPGRKAGDHRHADAGIDDPLAAADARRGQ
jgi:hypothetical protein